MNLIGIFFILIGLTNISHAKSYENYKLFSVIPKSEAEVQILIDLSKSEFDIWTDPFTVGSDARILVAPDRENQFIDYCKSVGIDPVLSIPNVQKLIDAQLKPAQNFQRNSLGSLTWNQYYNLAEIYAWLDEIQDLYPEVVTTFSIGNSLEERPIKGVIIDFKAGQRGDKPLTGMFEGGIHSREWISPATVTWIIKEFLTSSDPEVRFLAETFVWHFIPVLNPDGYAYSFTNDRMWRKNRNPANFSTCPTNDDLSNGVDLNRNFDFLWMTTGASDNPCAEDYAGIYPGSEPETQALSNYVQQVKQDAKIIYYFAFHSAAEMILIPYSHTTGTEVLQANNFGDLYEIAIRGAEKLIAKYGTPYNVGTSAEILYAVTGSSFDWIKGEIEVPISYLFELRGRSGGHGFLLPTEEIIPNNEEVMECLLEMDRTTRKLGYYSANGSTAFASVLSIVITGVILCILE